MRRIKKALINRYDKLDLYNNFMVKSEEVYYNTNCLAGIALMQIGTTIENFIRKFRTKRDPTGYIDIIVAGLGKCGTTMVSTYVWTTFPSLNIRKTHSLHPSILLAVVEPIPIRPTKNTKIIWMFGNPMNIVISSNSLHQLKLHYLNLQSPNYKQHSKRFTQDTLLLEKHFDAWYKPQKFEFLSVKYEGLRHQKNRDMIDDFLGSKLDLPAWKERSADWRTHPKKDELLRTYGRLAEKVEAAEDVKWWKPANL